MNWFQTEKPVYLLIYTAITLFAFIAVSYSISLSEVRNIDLSISKAVLLNRNIPMNIFFNFATTIFSPIFLSIYSILLIVHFLKHNENFPAYLLGFSMILGNLSFLGIKLYSQRARPPFIADQISGFSYPSGHATISALFFVFVIGFLTCHYHSDRQCISSIIIYLLFTIITGYSRIYLGYHWFSDIIGGYLLGIFILLFTTATIRVAIYCIRKRYSNDQNY